MSYTIDIEIDWNMQDDSGMCWTLARYATHPEKIVPGAVVVAGGEGPGSAVAVAEVVDRDEDGVVHLRPLPGGVKANLHRLTDPE